MSEEKIIILLICFNEQFKKKVKDYYDKFNFTVVDAPDITGALQEYIKERPYIICIDPFFTVQNVQGIDVLLQLKRNNATLVKPVIFIGLSQFLNNSTEKILQDTCDYYICEKTFHEFDNIMNAIIEKSNLKGKITITETIKFAKELSSNPFRTLVSEMKYKGSQEYIKALEICNQEITNTDADTAKDERRSRMAKVIKGFWQLYTEISKQFVKSKSEKINIETIAFLRFRSILNTDWLSCQVIDSIIDNIKNSIEKAAARYL